MEILSVFQFSNPNQYLNLVKRSVHLYLLVIVLNVILCWCLIYFNFEFSHCVMIIDYLSRLRSINYSFLPFTYVNEI